MMLLVQLHAGAMTTQPWTYAPFTLLLHVLAAMCDCSPQGGAALSSDSSSSVNVSYEEVIAQLTAEGVAGLSDEPQLADASLEQLPSFAAAEPAAVGMVMEPLEQHPELSDVAAAVGQPLPGVGVLNPAPLDEDERPDDALSAFDHLAVEPPAAANAGAVLQQPSLLDIAAAVRQEQDGFLEEDEIADDALGAFDHLAIDPPAAANSSAALQQPDTADIAAVREEQEELEAFLEEDESADEALGAFDHLSIDPPAAANAGSALQQPSMADVAAAVGQPLDASDPAAPVEEDESADEVLTTFDHLFVDPPAAANAGAVQQPSLADIAAAAEPADASLGEDEEADVALGAFDHIEFTVAAAVPQAAAGCGQAYKDPLLGGQLAGVGSGSTDEPAAATAAPVAAVAANTAPIAASAAAAEEEEVKVPLMASSVVGQPAAGGLAGLLQGWLAAVLKLFEEWQRSLAK